MIKLKENYIQEEMEFNIGIITLNKTNKFQQVFVKKI